MPAVSLSTEQTFASRTSTCDDSVGIWMLRNLDCTGISHNNLRLRLHILDLLLQIPDSAAILDGHQLWFELLDLLCQQVNI